MYNLLAQVAAPFITLLIIPAIFGVPGQANPIPQEHDFAKSKYRVITGDIPVLVNRKREAEALQVLPRAANSESPLAKREASILVSLPKREPQPDAASNVSLQPQKRNYGNRGCCGGGGWGW